MHGYQRASSEVYPPKRRAAPPVQGIESLSKLPSRCPPHRTAPPLRHEYRQLLVGSHLVFFTDSEQDELATVARVLHAGLNLGKQLEQPK